MRFRPSALAVAVLCCPVWAVEAQAPHDWLIVPGERIGPVTAETSERDLTAELGASSIEPREVYLAEGFCAEGSALYPGLADEVEIVWTDSTRSRPAFVRVAGGEGQWRTENGIRAGMPISELEPLAAQPLTFSGFGWDYGGGLGWPPDGGGPGLSLVVGPRAPVEASVTSDPRYSEVLGDRLVRSDHPLIARMDVRVELIELSFGSYRDHECRGGSTWTSRSHRGIVVGRSVAHARIRG